MSVTLHDLVVLGKTVPEPSRTDDRIYVCSAGWHPDHGLVRIYPLARRNAPARWNAYSVNVQRNPKDARPESWQLDGDRTSANVNGECFTHTGSWTTRQRADLIDLCDRRNLIVSSVVEANSRRMSLALVLPDQLDLRLEHNGDSPDSPQLRLFDDGLPAARPGARRFPWIPRLFFPGGHQSGMLLRDWGTFEFMRKFPDREPELGDALHLGPRSALLIGNLNQHRTTWVVISVLNVRAGQMALEVAS